MPAALLALLPLSNADAEIINRVYAVVGDKVITQYDLESMNPQKLRLIYEKFKDEDRQTMLNEFYNENLNNLIDNYVIEIAALSEGVIVSEKEVDGAIDDIMKKNSVDREKLETLLEAQHQTYAQYRWRIKIDIITARLMSTVFRPKIVISDADIQKFIAENQSTLDLSDMFELRMFHVANKEKLDEAMADFEKNKSFRDTAMKFSDDKTAENGGYLGWVELALLNAGIREAIGTQREGLVKPIEEDGSYRVFFIDGYKGKNDVDTDKKESISRTIRAKQSQAIFEEWLKDKKDEILIQKKYAS